MSETLTIFESSNATCVATGKNYKITDPFSNHTDKLVRDIDFGVIPNTRQPSLFKSGAQKIANLFGLLQHFTVENAIEDITHDPVVFFYRVRCDLVKIASDGTEYVFTTGHGSANTMERRNGRNPAWDSANATLKMAEKRALVAAALSISGLSSMFSQDLENEDFMSNATEITQADPEAPITNNQIRRLFAIAAQIGLTAKEAKAVLKEKGYASTRDIKQGDYDAVCDFFRKREEE